MEAEKIRELLEDIKDEGMLVIVEGLKDKRALESLGLTNIFPLKKASFLPLLRKLLLRKKRLFC